MAPIELPESVWTNSSGVCSGVFEFDVEIPDHMRPRKVGYQRSPLASLGVCRFPIVWRNVIVPRVAIQLCAIAALAAVIVWQLA